MNEDLLKELHKMLGGQDADYQDFKKEFNSSEELRKELHTMLGGNESGSYDDFMSEVGFNTPKPTKKASTPADNLQKSMDNLNTAMVGLNTSVGKLKGNKQNQGPPSIDAPIDISFTPEYKQNNSFYELDSKVSGLEEEVESASDSFLEKVGSAYIGGLKSIVSGGSFFGGVVSETAADREQEKALVGAATEKKADFYKSIDPEELKPITYQELYDGEAEFSTTREEAIYKANNKLKKHTSRLQEALSYSIEDLPEPEQKIAADLIAGKEVNLVDEPSPQLERTIKLIESYTGTKAELDNVTGQYNQILADVTSVIGEAKNQKKNSEEVKQTALNYLNTLKANTPIQDQDKIDDIIRLTEETMAVGGGNDQLLRSWMTGTVNKLYDTGESLIKGVKASFFQDATMKLVADEVQDVALDQAEDVLTTALQEPRSAFTGSITEEVVDKGNIRLVVKDGQVVDLRRKEDNSKIFFPTTEEIEIANSFNPETDKTRKDYRGKSIVSTTGQVLMDMVPMIGSSALTGGSTLGMMVGSTSVSYGSYYKQALESTGDIKRATLFAALTAPAIGFVESKIGNLESKLGRTLSNLEKKGIYNAVTSAADDVAREGIEAYVKGPGFLKRVEKVIEKSVEFGNDIKGELLEEFSNFPVEALTSSASGVPTEPITAQELEDTFILTTLASGAMSGANIMLNNKNDINELIGYAATRKDKFEEIADQWVNAAATDKEKEIRQKDIAAKKQAVNEVEDTFKYIAENNFDDKAKDKLTKLTFDKARAIYKLANAESVKTKASLNTEIDRISKKMNGITPLSEEPQVTPEKTFVNRDVTGKKIFTDFDNTLYNPKTGELTVVGKELKDKLESGEISPEDVEILTARSAEDASIIKELFPTLTIKSDLSPEAKAAEVAKAGGNSIFIDDNKENLAATTSGEVIDAATIVPQTPKEVEAEKVAEQKEAEAGTEAGVTTTTETKSDAVNDTATDAVSEPTKEVDIDSYISEIGIEASIGLALEDVDTRMTNAEYIQESELNNRADQLYSIWDTVDTDKRLSVDQKESIKSKIENQIQKLEQYELATTNKVGKTTEAKTVRGPRIIGKTKRGVPSKYEVTPKRFEEKSETVITTSDGKTIRGKWQALSDDSVQVVDQDGNIIPVTDGHTFKETIKDSNGNVVSAVMEDKGTGNTFTVENPDLALDIAIKAKEMALGPIEDGVFETVITQVTTQTEPILAREGRIQKQAPQAPQNTEPVVSTTTIENVAPAETLQAVEENTDQNTLNNFEITQASGKKVVGNYVKENGKWKGRNTKGAMVTVSSPKIIEQLEAGLESKNLRKVAENTTLSENNPALSDVDSTLTKEDSQSMNLEQDTTPTSTIEETKEESEQEAAPTQGSTTGVQLTSKEALKLAETNLKNSAKEFLKVFTIGDSNVGVIFDPKAAAITRSTAAKNFFNALVDYVKAKIASGKYDIQMFKEDLDKGSFGNVQISQEGVEYIFDEVNDPGKNREQVKVVEKLREEIDNLYTQFEEDTANTEEFAEKVNEIFKDLKGQQRATNSSIFFSLPDVNKLLSKASKIKSEQDLNEFSDLLESILEDKKVKKFKTKVDRNKKLAKNRVKALKTTDNDLKNAVSFNHRDRSFQAEDAKNTYQDVKRFNDFLETVNSAAATKDKKFLEDKKYFADKYKKQLEDVAAKNALKKAEFDKDGNLIEDGQIITPFDNLPKKYKDEFDRRSMRFDDEGNRVSNNGTIITVNENLSKKEKAELLRQQTLNKRKNKKDKKEKDDSETKQELLEEAQELQAESRPIHADEAIQSLSDQFLKLTKEDLESMTSSELAELVAGFKSLRDSNILQDSYEALLGKAKQQAVVKETNEVLEKSSGAFRNLLRDVILFSKGRGMTAQKAMEKFINNTPLRRVDAIFKGKDGTYFFDTFINPLAVGFGRFTAFNNRLKEKLRELSKNVSQRDSIKLMLYSIDKQYRNNPDSSELNSLAEEMENASKSTDSNYKEGDYKIAKEIYDELTELMGGEFDYRKMDSATEGPLALKPREKKLISFVEDLNNSKVGKIMTTAARTGKDTKIYNNYTPLDRVSSKTMGSVMKDFVEETLDATTFNLDSPTIPGNVNARVKNSNPIRNWNYVTSNYNSAKKTELDYEVRQNLKNFGNYTKAIIEDLNTKMNSALASGNQKEADKYKSYKDFISAMRVTVKDVARDNLVASFDELSDTEQALNFFVELGYASTLASVPRSGTEFLSNTLFALAAYPKEFIQGLNYMLSNKDFSGLNSDLDKLISLLPTTQSSRLLDNQGSLYRDQVRETKGFGATAAVTKGRRALESYTDMIGKFNNFLNSFGDKVVAKPMWYGSFEKEFNRLKKESGSADKFDIKKYTSDEQYRFDNAELAEKAIKIADANLSQGFSSFNPFESIADLKLHNKAGVVETFKRFLQRFIRFEYQSAEDAVSAIVGRGSMSRGKGVQLLTATVARMALYTLLAKALGDWFDDEIVEPTVNLASQAITGEDFLVSPDEDEEDWEEKLKTSLLGSIISLTLARRLNGLQKVPINFGTELLNVSLGDDLGLRKGEGYSPYKNSLVFSQIRIPNIEGFESGDDGVLFNMFGRDFRKPVIKDMNTADYFLRTLIGFTGPYNPLITNARELQKDLMRDLDKDLAFLEKINPLKEQAVKEYLPWFTGANLITTLIPTPAPRDIKRNINNLKAAIQFGPEIKDPVYQKAIKEGASLKEQKEGIDRLSDIRKDHVEKLEKLKDEFLKSEEWEEILEESKKKSGDEDKFTGRFINSKGNYLPERTYFRRGGAWFYEEGGEEKQVRSDDLLDQINVYSDEKDSRYAWERFMVEMHKMSFLYQVEPKEISVGEFEFIPRGYKGTKLEIKYGKMAPMKGETRFRISRFLN